MKFMSFGKDGGPESKVWGFWLIEIKSLFSIVLLRFENGTRSAYHNHAFNCFSWLLSGELLETIITEDKTNPSQTKRYYPSIFGFPTYRTTFHQVNSIGTSYVLSFRGPWAKTWKEYIPKEDKTLTLTNGRKVVE